MSVVDVSGSQGQEQGREEQGENGSGGANKRQQGTMSIKGRLNSVLFGTLAGEFTIAEIIIEWQQCW